MSKRFETEDMMGNGKIKAALNGPYIVENAPRLENSKGETLESKEMTALCRCGRSENKPYCDGAHAKVGILGSTREGRLEGRTGLLRGSRDNDP